VDKAGVECAAGGGVEDVVVISVEVLKVVLVDVAMYQY
jgi:hypothetical protein